MWSLSLRALTIGALFTLLCAGCGKPTAPAFTQSEAASAADLSLPEDFPSDIPLPSSYVVQSISDLGYLLVATLSTTQEISSLLDDTLEQLNAHGWQQMANISHANRKRMLVYQMDRRELSLTYSPSHRGPGTVITVQLRDPKRTL